MNQMSQPAREGPMYQKIEKTESKKTMENAKLDALVPRAIKGDKDAFNQIVSLKLESIMFGAINIMRQHQDAEDATQEIILTMYKSIKNLKEPKVFNIWLHRIINTQCYNMLRKKKRKENESFGMDEHILNIEEENREFLPQIYAEDKEYRAMIKNLIASLPNQKRQIVTMYYYDEFSYKEIAEVLDISINTVASDLKRARAHLKRQLEEVKPINEADVNKFAAVPVLSQVLADQAHEIMTPVVYKNMMAYTQTKVVAGAVAKNTSLFTLKNIIATVVCTAMITGGTVAVTNNINKDQTTDQGTAKNQITTPADFNPTGDIVYTDGDCSCGHVNPKEITLTDLDESYESVKWVITNINTNEELTGTGTDISAELEQLLSDKQDGEYKVTFTIEYPHGGLDMDRDFVIDSGEIQPGKYS